MRKYFLLGAVAMLATSTANATTDYAEVTAKATIEVASGDLCPGSLTRGFVIKQNNSEIIANATDRYGAVSSSSSDLISISETDMSSNGEGFLYCDFVTDNITVPDSVPLKNGEKSIIFRPEADMDSGTIYGSYTIPANITSGDYIGTFTVTQTY